MKPILFCIHGLWATPSTFTRLKARFEFSALPADGGIMAG